MEQYLYGTNGRGGVFPEYMHEGLKSGAYTTPQKLAEYEQTKKDKGVRIDYMGRSTTAPMGEYEQGFADRAADRERMKLQGEWDQYDYLAQTLARIEAGESEATPEVIANIKNNMANMGTPERFAGMQNRINDPNADLGMTDPYGVQNGRTFGKGWSTSKAPNPYASQSNQYLPPAPGQGPYGPEAGTQEGQVTPYGGQQQAGKKGGGNIPGGQTGQPQSSPYSKMNIPSWMQGGSAPPVSPGNTSGGAGNTPGGGASGQSPAMLALQAALAQNWGR